MQGRFFENPEVFYNLIKAHEAKNQVFTDEDFPAKDESLIDPNDDIDDLQDLGQVNWKRIPEIPGLKDENGQLHIIYG